jgi:hypothetical protein
MSTLLIDLDHWARVRGQFTDAERVRLTAHIVSHVVCPRGVVVDLQELPASLADKVRDALAEVRDA